MSHNYEGKIVDVYEDNLEEELKKISYLVEEYNFVSMDTEFPGIVFPLNQNSQYTSKNIEALNMTYNPKTEKSTTESNYKNIKTNVDNLKMIQIGITLSNEAGEFPEGVSTWQFNFKFDLEKDAYLSESINLLEMAGIDFKKFSECGINIETFAELFTTSGLVLNDNVKWVTFHGSYDFAYLIKALSNQPLPEEENMFNEMLGLYYCNFYDVRHMIRNIAWLKGSLTRISTDLDLRRVGQSHQAGSDSLITSKVFFKIMNTFAEHIDLYSDRNKLFGFSYKLMEDFDWGSNYPNNFPYGQIPSYMGIPNMNMSHMNVNVNHPQHMHHISPLINSRLSVGNNVNVNNITKTSSQNTVPNMVYFQNMNGFPNYQNGNTGMTNLNNINNVNHMNMFYGNSNFNYQQGMDYNYYNNFYNNGISTSGNKQINNGVNGNSKFIS